MLAMYFQDWSYSAVPLCIGIGLLPAIALIDFHFGIIPDGLNIALGIFGLIFATMRNDNFYLSISVAAVMLAMGLFFALVYSKWRGREMLGLGDVKYFAAAGFWLLPGDAPWFLAISGLFGVAFHYLWKRISSDKQFPFAPALCLSLITCILYRVATTP